MGIDPEFLHVEGNQIVDGRSRAIRLRGVCLGGWMTMENFIIGYPGHESGFRSAVARVLGEGRAHFFFDRFLEHFITEDDLAFVQRLGANAVRVPLNYRHFESDVRPFEYRQDGFARLDRLIGWARAHQLYVILDLHAVQGWQSPGWHCDNGCHAAHFWGQKVFADRAVAWWEELARHYRGEPTVAGYDVMNEPAADDASPLNAFYRRVTTAIRAIDSNPILFLEGNMYAQQFEQLDPPFDGNTAYSSHHYVPPATDDGEYPGEFNGVMYDCARLEQDYSERTAFMRRNHVPNWVGEFGALFGDPRRDGSRLSVLSDLIDIIERNGHHWTFWSLKDLGTMGLIALDPQSEWMERTRPVRELKTALRCDHWIERGESALDPLVREIGARTRGAPGADRVDWNALDERLYAAIFEGAVSQSLLPAFAEQFRGMKENEIDRMMESFEFRNCVLRTDRCQLVSRAAMRAEAR